MRIIENVKEKCLILPTNLIQKLAYLILFLTQNLHTEKKSLYFCFWGVPLKANSQKAVNVTR